MSYVLNRGFGVTGSQYISAGGGTLLAAAPFTGPAAPFVAAAGAIADMLASFGVGSGCGQTCVLSTQFANQAEGQLKQNLAMYLALPSPRPLSAQTAAVANFDQIWNWIVQQCSNPQLGAAGRACISDRQAGACKWKDSSGNCFNWFSGYRDPIANDPNVYNDSLAAAAASPLAAVSAALTSSGASSSSLLLPLGILALLGLVAFSS